jgi:hypothetical protein
MQIEKIVSNSICVFYAENLAVKSCRTGPLLSFSGIVPDEGIERGN